MGATHFLVHLNLSRPAPQWPVYTFSSLVAVILIFNILPRAQDQKGLDRRPFCEGRYSRLSEDASKHNSQVEIDRWQMYTLSDGSYSVDVELSPFRDGHIVQEHRILSRDLKPKAFSLELPSRIGPDPRPFKLDCAFPPTEIHCTVSDIRKGGSVSAVLAQKMPYVFMPAAGAFPADPAWFSPMLLSQATRAVGQKTSIPLVTMEDSEAMRGIKLTAIETEQIEYLGRENLKVLDRNVLAHKFRSRDLSNPDDPDGTQFFWTCNSGLVLQVADKFGPTIILSAYNGPLLEQ